MSEHVFNVTLHYPGPWGFRLAGGVDFNQPLSISRITPGGKGAVANILPNDVVLRIDGEDAMHMTHLDAQNKIKNCVGDLSLTLTRFDFIILTFPGLELRIHESAEKKEFEPNR
uniref:PDZ and LIM domain protein 1-like n=1 Tax=Saccoglossus kowalevskii TaxID=10224 RepID=A0ABM0M055_SACKO|nr:PREDICTED: PDZ and LIM domain protein 1-like [Saccoglossus kowalevskii]